MSRKRPTKQGVWLGVHSKGPAHKKTGKTTGIHSDLISDRMAVKEGKLKPKQNKP